MRKKNATDDERNRLAQSLQAAFGEGEGGGYVRSSAFTESTRKRLMGRWILADHSIGGRPWIEAYAAQAMPGRVLEDLRYGCSYEFREGVCTKRTLIEGWLRDGEKPLRYEFSMSVALSWKAEGHELRTRPEIGYQIVKLDGVPAAVKDFGHADDWTDLVVSPDGDELVIVAGDDRKLLRRMR